jgi:hypothetical protein
MSTTFAARLASDEGRDLRKYVTIEGVRAILQDGDEDVPAALIASSRTRVRCITALEQDRRELDMVARRAKGGGLRLRLVDDDSHTLRSLFAMRKRRATFITGHLSAAATTITVKNTAGFPVAGDFWVGGECISYTSKTGTSFVDCTRGAYGTRARALRGGTNNGQAVYSAPPSWMGRVVTLKGYFREHDGSDPTSTDMQATLGTFELDAPPQYLGGDEWELSAVDRVDGFLRKGLYVGVEPTTYAGLITIPPVSTGTGSSADMYVSDTDRLKLVGTTANTSPGDYAFVRLDGVAQSFNLLVRVTDTDSGEVAVPPFDAVMTANYLPDLNRSLPWILNDEGHGTLRSFTSARAVAYLHERADRVALKALSSRSGNGANGSYDVLLGRNAELASDDADPDLLAWRMGAAITLADIDTTAFETVGKRHDWWYLISEPTTVGDFLRDFCLATDSFVCTNVAGQLTVQSMSDSLGTSIATTIDADDVVGLAPIKASYDEENVYPNIVLDCAYDARTEKFNERVALHDNELAERYPQRDRTLEIKSKAMFISGLWTDEFWIAVPGVPLAEAHARLRRYQSDEGGRGALYLDVRVHLDHALLDLGDLVTLTLSDIPDMEGSTISARRCRVVSTLTDWREGTVDLRLQVLRGPKLISPAAIIDSVAGNVLTLKGVHPEMGATGGLSFGSNNNVIIWDVDGNQSFATTLTAAGATTVTLNALPGAFTIEDDVDFITMGVASTNDTNITQNGYTPATDFIFQVDDDEYDYEADLTGNGESRWR